MHGDPNPGNVRMTAERGVMIDWDESHVDVPDLDLDLPHNAAGLDDDAYDRAAQARAAWEAAVCWDPTGTDPFAERRLAEVRVVWSSAAIDRNIATAIAPGREHGLNPRAYAGGSPNADRKAAYEITPPWPPTICFTASPLRSIVCSSDCAPGPGGAPGV